MAVVIALVGAAALGAACGRAPRCDEAASKTCPAGQERSGDTIESSCASRYDGPCGSEWADYVDCVADNAPTCYDRANKTYTNKSPCYEGKFRLFTKCQCAHETQNGGKSPWCSF